MRMNPKVIVWIAQGFGIGRLKPGPGTWGSLLGLAWFAALLMTGSVVGFVMGAAAGVMASVWFCGATEKILGQKDPGSVVLDEVAAIPFCFGAWVATVYLQSGRLPGPEHFFWRRTGSRWCWCLARFVFSTSSSRGPYIRASRCRAVGV